MFMLASLVLWGEGVSSLDFPRCTFTFLAVNRSRSVPSWRRNKVYFSIRRKLCWRRGSETGTGGSPGS